MSGKAQPQETAWFMRRGEQKYGPYTDEKLRLLVGMGKITPDDLLGRKGMASWTLAGDIPELRHLFGSSHDAEETPQPRPDHQSVMPSREAPITPVTAASPRRTLNTVHVVIVCTTALIGLAIWRLTTPAAPPSTPVAAPAATVEAVRTNTQTPPTDQAPRKSPPVEIQPRPEPVRRSIDLSWTSAFPNRESESSLQALVPVLDTRNLTKDQAALGLIFMAGSLQSRSNCLYEGSHRVNVEPGRVLLGPIPLPMNTTPAELYRALRSAAGVIHFACGFDVEMDIAKPQVSNYQIRPRVQYVVRTLMITGVDGASSLWHEEMLPLIGKRFDFR